MRTYIKWTWGLLYLILGFLLYFPILNNAFISDDYDSLYRIVVERKIIIKEFFRPMIDLSFYFNYLLSGMNPSSYYVFNIIIHIVNAVLIYLFVLHLKIVETKTKEKVAIISGLLFLIYPFHSEGVVWLTGRLASMACLFSLLCANLIFWRIRMTFKVLFCVLFYFLGLLAYESILFLPFILLFFWWDRTKTKKETAKVVVLCSFLILTYLLTRYFFSGVIYGNYGGRMLVGGVNEILLKFFKTFGRTILPPLENSGLLIGLFAFFISLMLFGAIQLYKKRHTIVSYNCMIRTGLAFLMSILIPVLFGVSTRTSEGDRLLYFPSVFLVIIIALGLMQITHKPVRWVLLALVVLYFSTFLLVNNFKWEKASVASEAILTEIIKNKGKQNVIVNLPDELEGAFVFRNGFYKALLLNGVDTANVTVNNYLTRLEYLRISQLIEVDTTRDAYLIAPVTKVMPLNDDRHIIKVENVTTNKYKIVNTGRDVLYFWNKFELKEIQ